MRKANNYQDQADKAIKSAIRWAYEDALKEDAESVKSANYAKMVDDFNAYTKAKYSSPHDFVIIREESLRNRYDEVFYILTEANQKGLFTENTHELCIALLTIAESVPEYENEDEPQEHDENFAKQDEEVKKFFENFELSIVPIQKGPDSDDNLPSAMPPSELDSESEDRDWFLLLSRLYHIAIFPFIHSGRWITGNVESVADNHL